MHRRAFSLVELLVVLAVIGLLIGLLLPAVQAARESSRRIQCVNNLKQVGIACQNYHGAMGRFPPGYCAAGPYVDGATDTAPGWGWEAFLLAYLEQRPVYDAVNFTLPIEHPSNARAVQTRIASYLCPSDVVPQSSYAVPDSAGKTIALAAPSSYTGSIGSDDSGVSDRAGCGIFFRNSGIRFADLVDGTTFTILAGEKAFAKAQGIWAGAINRGVVLRGKYNNCQPVISGMYYPAPALVLAHAHLNNAELDADGSAGMDDFSSMHLLGSNFLFADGSVHFIQSISADGPNGYTNEDLLFQSLGTRAGGEVVPGYFIK